jgi:Zn-finger nucleic acid-binding protein
MPATGLVCDYCGKRNPLNLLAIEEAREAQLGNHPQLDCPICETKMELIDVGILEPILIHRCAQCDGMFIDEEHLQKVIKHHSGVLQVVDQSMLRFVLDHPRHDSDVNAHYKNCPVCHEPMRKLTYASVSGVQIDKCREHGIWLDSGELQQLFDWRSTTISLKRQEIQNKRTPKTSQVQPHFKLTKETTHDPFEGFLIWLFGAGMV